MPADLFLLCTLQFQWFRDLEILCRERWDMNPCTDSLDSKWNFERCSFFASNVRILETSCMIVSVTMPRFHVWFVY